MIETRDLFDLTPTEVSRLESSRWVDELSCELLRIIGHTEYLECSVGQLTDAVRAGGGDEDEDRVATAMEELARLGLVIRQGFRFRSAR
jgi:hypothetical protein